MAIGLLSSEISKPVLINRIQSLSQSLHRRQIIGSLATALETVKLLREVIANAKFNSFEQLCTHLTQLGSYLSEKAPREFVIGNMVKRVLILLHEEYASALATHLSASATPTVEHDFPAALRPISHPAAPPHRQIASINTFCPSPPPSVMATNPAPNDSIFRLLGQKLMTHVSAEEVNDQDGSSKAERNFSKRAFALKPIFIEAVQELHDELELTRENVAAQAAEHIHSGEVIMTMDHSRTVQSFLQAAAKSRRTFTVIVAETAPTFSGRTLAAELINSTPPVATMSISDASSFALMSRCTKLIIGCHAVFADGSVLAKSGALGLVMAARAHLVPVVVVSGMYKFSPEFVRAEEEWSIADLQNPDEILNPNTDDDQETFPGTKTMGEIEVLNPYYDRVPAELVSLFITNLGGHPSSLVYRLLKDLYGAT